jgi:hypothetical protein
MTKAFKTTERKRQAAQKTRADRLNVRKPQPNVVDEAVTAALMSTLERLRAEGGPAASTAFSVYGNLLEVVLAHLADRRGYHPDRSREALKSRLSNRRRYGVISDTR